MTYPAAELALNTADAYMADEYGETEWESCAQLLLNSGCTMDEAEAFLRSKHMRWAGDMAEGKHTVATLRRYIKRTEFGSRLAPHDLRTECREILAGK